MDDGTNIKLQIQEIKVATNYAKESLTVNPSDTLIFNVKLPGTKIFDIEDGVYTLTFDGVQALIKAVKETLYEKTNPTDF